MKFSERLRELREQAQMTQKQLAEKSGVQSRMIQRYEAGTSHPRISAVEKLAVALETSVDNLMGKTEQSFANFGEENGSKAERDLVAQAETNRSPSANTERCTSIISSSTVAEGIPPCSVKEGSTPTSPRPTNRHTKC